MCRQEREELSLRAKQEPVALVIRLCRPDLRGWCWSCTARHEGELGLNENTFPVNRDALKKKNQMDRSTAEKEWETRQ